MDRSAARNYESTFISTQVVESKETDKTENNLTGRISGTQQTYERLQMFRLLILV